MGMQIIFQPKNEELNQWRCWFVHIKQCDPSLLFSHLVFICGMPKYFSHALTLKIINFLSQAFIHEVLHAYKGTQRLISNAS